MYRCLVLLIAVAIGSVPAWAQSHLEPEQSPLFYGMAIVPTPGVGAGVTLAPGEDKVEQLRPVLNGQVLAAMVATPSFSDPFAVGIRRPVSSYEIFAAWPSDSKNRHRPVGPLAGCDLAIASPLAERILGAWKAVLMETRYDERPYGGADGEGAHFAAQYRGQLLMGGLWTPETVPSSRPGLLRHIAGLMVEACEAKSLSLDKQQEIERYLDKILGAGRN